MSEKPQKPKKRGRPASGKSREEILRESKKRSRERMQNEGYVEVHYKLPRIIAERIEELKEKHDYDELGQVVAAVFRKEIEPGNFNDG